MTDESLKITLSNLRDDIDMLLNAHYSTSEDGIAGMKERIASAIANIDTLTTGLSETNTKLSQDEATLNTCVEHNTFYDQSIAPLVEQNRGNISDLWGDFRSFLDDFLKLEEKQSTVELGEKIAIWSNYLSKLRIMLDILDEQDAQALKDLLENGTSGSATVSEELENQVNQNTANITTLQGKVTNLESKVSKLLTPDDPNYTPPKTFSDYPAGTILQGYAKFDRRLLKKYSNSMKTFPVVFTAEADSEGTLKIKLVFTLDRVTEGWFHIYQNDTEIFDEKITYSDFSGDLVYEKEIKGITCASGNVFYVKLDPSPASATMYLKRLTAELIAPNAEIINQISPYSVDIANGRYYISDCSSGTAKIADIAIEDMTNIDALNFVDTGIECYQYKTAFTVEKYGYTKDFKDRVDYYLNGEGVTFLNKNYEDADAVYKQIMYIDWLPQTDSFITTVALKDNSTTVNTLNFTPSTKGTYFKSLSNQFGAYYLIASKYWNECLTQDITRSVFVGIKNDGHCYVSRAPNYNSIVFDAGFGVNPHCYMAETDSTQTYFDLYYKYYDKIIKKRFKQNSSNYYSTISTEEIGKYEEYFKGANNDYFVVKNGKLCYYKLPDENVDTSQESST